MEHSLEKDWNRLLRKISDDFKVDASLNGTLFLIGIQEKGEGYSKTYSKENKLELINLAECKLLMRWNYYSIEGYDKENWPIFKKNKIVPPLSKEKEQQLLKSAIVEYFKESGYLRKN